MRKLGILVALLLGVVALPGCYPKGGFPLRHDFSLDPALPGGTSHTPTSCYDVGDQLDHYTCRLVWGYEEAGDNQDYLVDLASVVSQSPVGKYGALLVTSRGNTYEGCDTIASNGSIVWKCDYHITEPVSRQHFQHEGYVLDVFWNWKNYAIDQGGACALAATALWKSALPGRWAALLGACHNGPPSSMQ